MRISVDRGRCSGHGLCVFEAPDVYTLGDDGYNNTPSGDVPEERQDAARRGAEACPERAIHLES